MTVLATVITRDWALQVSDRRLTYLNPFRIKDDDATKAVLYNGFTTFAYTGLAQLHVTKRVITKRSYPEGLVDSSFWLALVLSTFNSPDEIREGLPGELKEAIEKSGAPRAAKAHAVLGAGWVNRRPGDPIEPAVHVVSNLEDVNQFKSEIIVLAPGQKFKVVTSRPLFTLLDTGTQRLIRKQINGANDPAVVAAILVKAVRDLANRDKTVGKGVLVTCLPRPVMESALRNGNWEVRAGRPGLDRVTFDHLPADSNDGVFQGPALAMGDLVAGRLAMNHEGDVVISLPIGS